MERGCPVGKRACEGDGCCAEGGQAYRRAQAHPQRRAAQDRGLRSEGGHEEGRARHQEPEGLPRGRPGQDGGPAESDQPVEESDEESGWQNFRRPQPRPVQHPQTAGGSPREQPLLRQEDPRRAREEAGRHEHGRRGPGADREAERRPLQAQAGVRRAQVEGQQKFGASQPRTAQQGRQGRPHRPGEQAHGKAEGHGRAAPQPVRQQGRRHEEVRPAQQEDQRDHGAPRQAGQLGPGRRGRHVQQEAPGAHGLRLLREEPAQPLRAGCRLPRVEEAALQRPKRENRSIRPGLLQDTLPHEERVDGERLQPGRPKHDRVPQPVDGRAPHHEPQPPS
mmetsp:Transcript_3378/g.5674  ORF Transcript_3378/g.5674 Transcript_3378/m.5674 type:complete len:335 (+) Transcript_3378:746-1750(+)